MPYRPKDIYRGRRKFRVPLNILLFVLAFLLVGGISLFFLLQRYMVYDADGATLQLPFLDREEQADTPADVPTPKPAFEPVPVTVTWEDPDYEDVDLGGWEGLHSIQGHLFSAATINDPIAFSTALSSFLNGSYTTAILEMKDRSGQLVWPSTSELAQSYFTYGAADVTDAITQIHDAGKTVAARISCFCDNLLVQRNWSTALQSGAGGLYQDSDGYFWVDPYNNTVRTYITQLAQELADMGFDEIILTDLCQPLSEQGFTYTVALHTAADPVVAVCQAGRRVAEALADSETAVSAQLDTASLRQGLAGQTGQDIAVFWRLFARLYCPTSPDMIASDRETAAADMENGNTDQRFIPITPYAPEGEPSYVTTQ